MNLFKYRSEINNFDFSKMTKKAQDLFFVLLKNSDEKGNVEIQISELKKFIKIKNSSNARFFDVVYNICSDGQQRDPITMEIVPLFVYFDDTEDGRLKTRIHNNFLYLLSDKGKPREYTTINLEEMCSFSSRFSKIIYRYIKQYEKYENLRIEIIILKNILGLSESYKFPEINKKVLSPILKELSPIFKELSVIKNKSDSRGSKIESITLTWKNEVKKRKRKSYKITQEQYEEMYQKYLTDGNGIDNEITRKMFDMWYLKKYKNID